MIVDFSKRWPVFLQTTGSDSGHPESEQTREDIIIYKSIRVDINEQIYCQTGLKKLMIMLIKFSFKVFFRPIIVVNYFIL